MTLPTTSFASSKTGESNGTSCEGKDSAAEEADLAEDGTNSIEPRSVTPGSKVEHRSPYS